MNASAIYAIAAGGIFAGFLLRRTLSILIGWAGLFSVLVYRHLTLRVIVHRHRLWGPLSRASIILHASYITVNVFLIFYRSESLTGAGRRAGELALINLIFPLSAIDLSYLADLLGFAWRSCHRIHRATGWMVVALLSFHVIVAVQDHRFSFPLDESQNLFAMIGALSLGVLALLSIAWLRRWSYEIFLRGHQVLAGLFAYGTWQHLVAKSDSPIIYLWIALGILGLTSCLQLAILVYRNGLFAGSGAPRALVSFTTKKSGDSSVVTAIRIRIRLPRPVHIEPGQYINLWMPSVSLWSWTQTHPFTVTSWSRGRQDTMELLVQPRRGLTADLARHESPAAESSVSFLALYTGPHGMSDDVGHYESVLLIASGFGVAAVIPYLKKMIYGYNTCTLQVRRLHLVWQVKSIDMTFAAQSLINGLLEDDIIDKGYILTISIYVEKGLAYNKTPFGKHKSLCFYQGVPDIRSIISAEASGDEVERLPNIRDEQGQTLVMVSTEDDLRDHIRETVRGYLHQNVKFSELEYQPSTD